MKKVCKCEEMSELEGNAALHYIKQHLEMIEGKDWQIIYQCPITKIKWLLDYPHGEYHGGGSPRLRKLPLIDQ